MINVQRVDLGFFRNLPQLSVLSDEEIQWLIGKAKKSKYEAGEFVFHQGAHIDYVFFLEFGQVEIFKSDINGKKLTLWYIGDDEMFCLANLYAPQAFANAKTLSDCLIYSLGRADFDWLAANSANLSHNLVRCISGKLSAYSNLLDDLAFKRIEGRLATIFLSRVPPREARKGVCYLNQEELAAMAGTSREVVARCLKSLRERGLITKLSNRTKSPILILDYSKMKQLAEG